MVDEFEGVTISTDKKSFILGDEHLNFIMKKFEIEISPLVRNNNDLFDYFGFMNSRLYSLKFLDVSKDISPQARTLVIALCSIIKSHARIIDNIDKLKHGGSFSQDVIDETKRFMMNSMVQYTKQVKRSPEMFAVIHVPTAFPFMAAFFWVRMKKYRSDENIEKYFERFFENFWIGQLNLSAELQMKHYRWEKNMWTETIKTTNNEDTKANFEKNRGFNKDWYQNKINDSYHLIDKNGKMVKPSNYEINDKAVCGFYTKGDIIKWIASIKGSAPMSS